MELHVLQVSFIVINSGLPCGFLKILIGVLPTPPFSVFIFLPKNPSIFLFLLSDKLHPAIPLDPPPVIFCVFLPPSP